MTAEECRDLVGCRQAPQKTPHLAFGGQVEASRGLVEEQDFRAAHERTRNLDAPLHARAVRANQLAAEPGVKTDIVKDALHFADGIRHLTTRPWHRPPVYTPASENIARDADVQRDLRLTPGGP